MTVQMKGAAAVLSFPVSVRPAGSEASAMSTVAGSRRRVTVRGQAIDVLRGERELEVRGVGVVGRDERAAGSVAAAVEPVQVPADEVRVAVAAGRAVADDEVPGQVCVRRAACPAPSYGRAAERELVADRPRRRGRGRRVDDRRTGFLPASIVTASDSPVRASESVTRTFTLVTPASVNVCCTVGSRCRCPSRRSPSPSRSHSYFVIVAPVVCWTSPTRRGARSAGSARS